MTEHETHQRQIGEVLWRAIMVRTGVYPFTDVGRDETYTTMHVEVSSEERYTITVRREP